MGIPTAGYEFFFSAIAVALGAVVGSFLNVCIYRLPIDMSVNRPRRSFCPSCKTQLTWYQNVPLLSWLFLRGKCANCGARIAFRYFFPVGNGDRLLGFCFAPHRRHLHRLRAFHYPR
jgi:hypothetical protein